MKTRILIIGATGSLGTQLLEIVSRYSDEFTIVGMTAHKNAEKLLELADQFEVPKIFLNTRRLDDLRAVSSPLEFFSDNLDQVFVLDHGLESYHFVLESLVRQKRVCVANKELMVVHGQDIMYLAKEQQASVIPLDSEHNALFQAIQGEHPASVKRVILTASGGPFRDKSYKELKNVTIEEVLKHPTWKMGAKTTVDSATLVNKGFEVIEAMNLFDLRQDQIEIRLHPESIIHAIVEFTDGTSKMIAYPPDMRSSLGYALFFPQRAPENLVSEPSFFDYDQPLHLEKIEEGRFPCLDFILKTASQKPECLKQLVENDERIVNDFLNHEIEFHDILEGLKENIL